MINAILIDDEPIALQALQVAIDRYCPEVHIKGAYQSPEQGLEAIRKVKPDLVFLDIQMPQMSGFDVLMHAAPVTFEVIFVSAHDHYAIKAFRFSALDYLLKPIDIDDLHSGSEKSKRKDENQEQFLSVSIRA